MEKTPWMQRFFAACLLSIGLHIAYRLHETAHDPYVGYIVAGFSTIVCTFMFFRKVGRR